MRQRLSDRYGPRSPVRAVVAVAAIGAALALAAAPVRAQSGAEDVFLLLPVGARAVGMGEAVVAEQGGSDALWWNPAAVGGMRQHEIAIHHSETVVGQGNALAAVLPFAHVGTFGLTLNVLDLGRQAATDEQGNIQGIITPTDFAYGLTYAATPVPMLALGATVKHVDARISCSGLCANLPAGASNANGADVGAQLRPPGSPLTIGLAARNLGIGSGDARPARLDAGADYRVRMPRQYADLVDIHAAAGVVTTTRLDSATARIGTDITLEQRLHVRAGYIHDPANGSGGAVGVGLSSGKLVFDLARTFGGLSANGDKPPTYFSLRYVW
jgi:hypothetical protein